MTKQSSRSPLCRRSLWIALLATLAFAGAGQALAPASAAALHIDACAQPEFGLCDAADEGPTSGDSSSGESKGGGRFGGLVSSFPQLPPFVPWEKPSSRRIPPTRIDAFTKIRILSDTCGVIGRWLVRVERKQDKVIEMREEYVANVHKHHGTVSIDGDFGYWRLVDQEGDLIRAKVDLEIEYEKYNCIELNF